MKEKKSELNFNCEFHFYDENGNEYPEWEEKTLGDIVDIIGGGTPSTNEVSYWDGDINWFSPTEIKTKFSSSSIRKITPEGLKKSSAKILDPGTVLLTTRATLGRMSILTEEASTNQGFQSLIPKKNETISEFIYQLQPQIEKYCYANASGSTFKEISKFVLAKMPLLVPSLPEQEKIAEFLSALDERIELQERKIELLVEQKKGYVQRIFNRELCFHDNNGNQYPEWEEKALGDSVGKIITGKLDANQGVTEGAYRFYTCAAQYSYINNYAYDTEAILISGNGANVGYVHYYKGKFNAYQRTYIVYPSKNGETSLLFLRFLMQYALPKRINLEKNAGSMPYIVMSTLTEMKIFLPSTLEQEKIANFLSTLDEQISLEKEKLVQLNLQKQGYMQRIFA